MYQNVVITLLKVTGCMIHLMIWMLNLLCVFMSIFVYTNDIKIVSKQTLCANAFLSWIKFTYLQLVILIGRTASNSEIDIQGLMEIYLSASEMCIQDCFWTILCWLLLNRKIKIVIKILLVDWLCLLKDIYIFCNFWSGYKLCANNCLDFIWFNSISDFLYSYHPFYH